MPNPGTKTPLVLRLMRKQIPHKDPSACWGWAAATKESGYAVIANEEMRLERAHRVSYRLFVGPIPQGLCVLHSCDNPSCTNPAHLFTGTYADNHRDMHLKGRANDEKNKLLQSAIRADNKTGYKGVVFADGRYKARVTWHGRVFCLGGYDSPEEAAVARDAAALFLTEGKARVNFPGTVPVHPRLLLEAAIARAARRRHNKLKGSRKHGRIEPRSAHREAGCRP